MLSSLESPRTARQRSAPVRYEADFSDSPRRRIAKRTRDGAMKSPPRSETMSPPLSPATPGSPASKASPPNRKNRPGTRRRTENGRWITDEDKEAVELLAEMQKSPKKSVRSPFLESLFRRRKILMDFSNVPEHAHAFPPRLSVPDTPKILTTVRPSLPAGPFEKHRYINRCGCGPPVEWPPPRERFQTIPTGFRTFHRQLPEAFRTQFSSPRKLRAKNLSSRS